MTRSRGTWCSLRAHLAVLMFATGLPLAPCAGAVPANAVRLADYAGGHTTGTIIAGTYKHTIDPTNAENIIALPYAPAHPLLSFATGMRAFDRGGTVRFEIALRPKSGPDVTLFDRSLTETGWSDEAIDLSPYPLDGAALVFRRTLVDGPTLRLLNTAWGDPVIVPSVGPPAPSVILISLDTVRADRLGVTGDANARTPAVDRVAAEGVLYEQTYSPSTWTVPSHRSLFFGLYPAASNPDATVPPGVPTPDTKKLRPLAERFRDAGYLTAGFTGGGYLSDNFGFGRGFDTYYMFEQPTGRCDPERFDGQQVASRAVRWLQERGHAPFFLFVHTYDAHDRCPFETPGSNGFAWGFVGAYRKRQASDYYDEVIGRADQLVAAIVRELDSLGLAQSTLVVVLSDHGEGFSEHGIIGHGPSLKPYEELTRVPLILRYPGVVPAGQRISTPVSLVDVAPSIVALFNLPSDARTDGHLLPGFPAPNPTAARSLFAQSDDLLAVRDGPHKLITSRTGAFPDEVYDLEHDRAETQNLALTDTHLATALRQEAAEYWSHAPSVVQPPAGQPRLDPETRERLRALGYQ